jgi:hypothetical protein
MNLPFLLLFRAFAARRSISFADVLGVPWETVPINSFFGEFAPPMASVRKSHTNPTGASRPKSASYGVGAEY